MWRNIDIENSNTYHIPPQIALLLILEPPQILQHTRTGIRDILRDSHLSLLEMSNGLTRLPDVVAAGLLWVHVRQPMHCMADPPKDLIGDEVTATALLVRQVAVFWYALLCTGRSAIVGGWEVRVYAFCFFWVGIPPARSFPA